MKNMSGREVCRSMYITDRITLPSPWGKLYRIEMFDGERFPVGRIYEDEDLIPRIIYRAKKVVILKSWLYFYRQRVGSTLNTDFSKRKFEYMDAFDTCIHFFLENGEGEIAKMAMKYKQGWWANYVIKAWMYGFYHKLPERHKMPLWKAVWTLCRESLHRGGIKFVFHRIRNMFRRFSHK